MDTHLNKKRRRDDASHRFHSDLPHFEHQDNITTPLESPSLSNERGYIVVHRVECTVTPPYHQSHAQQATYFDIPYLPAHSNRKTGLCGQEPLGVLLESYLEDHPDLSFAVYLTYDCSSYHEECKDSFKKTSMPYMDRNLALEAKPYFYVLRQDAAPAKPHAEKLILSEGLDQALEVLFGTSKEKHTEHEGEEDGRYDICRIWRDLINLTFPYQELYHRNEVFREEGTRETSPGSSGSAHLRVLSRYLDERLGPIFAEAEALFERGLSTREHWAKLFYPGAVIVTHEHGEPQAYLCTSWPTTIDGSLRVNCWSWAFDGKFFKNEAVLVVSWPSDSDTIHITDLHTYPLRHAHEIFWACRFRKFVNYDVPLEGMEVQKTFKLMHGDGDGDGDGDEDLAEARTELGEDMMGNDGVPPQPFALLLPAFIRGYGFHNKKWNRLQVKHVRDIQWNKAAFNHRLVLKEEKKELIRALISVHIGQRNSIKTDFMDGKGEGLIILLHGGPGTGKTLTAESVAEYAERPLYRVTCGDIGTDPESVEKYLESVLFIGSTWGCVVLLDEADVFLEERTKTDMQRNALVSVFLRVLEYYDGILILTTNRIGTFDEAFKSRVQLALHYPPLNERGRKEIWHNFMRSLKTGGEHADFDEIEEKLHVLAEHKLNGRQIRNTISTARQLARYKGENLRFVHINQALQVVDEFEKYVLDVHGHADEEYARDQGNR
ncbi:hypothetical protein HBI23_131260 [Parastagonospora nodorum]|nr:hypothetical protein HBI47_030770 [Parastagonospora nodorum]KAH5660330.1 hypothetical protein HBI23_131260 [Parastagonospora nodorum]